jgi:hypothetical protein
MLLCAQQSGLLIPHKLCALPVFFPSGNRRSNREYSFPHPSTLLEQTTSF